MNTPNLPKLLIIFIFSCTLKGQAQSTARIDSVMFEETYKSIVAASEGGNFSSVGDAKDLLRTAIGSGDSLLIARATDLIGLCYMNANNFDSASYYYISAQKLALRIGDKETEASVYNGLGALYYMLGDYEESIAQAQAGRRIFEESGVGNPIAIYGQLGTSFSYMASQDSAEKYFLIAAEFLEQKQDASKSSAASLYNNLGGCYFFQGKYEKAIESYNKSLKAILDDDIDTTELQFAVAYINLGEAYGYLNQFERSFSYLNRGLSIARSKGDDYVALSALSMLSDIHERQGNQSEALFYTKAYMHLKDSLFSIGKARQISEMKTRYETEKKETQIALLEENRKIDELEIQKARNRVVMLVIAALLFLAIAAFVSIIFVQTRRRKREVEQRNETITKINKALNKSQDALMLSNKTKDRFFAIIAHDLRGPVTSLQGIGRMLGYYNKKGDENRINELISHVDQSAQSVNHLLDNLLKWALSQTDGLSYQPTTFELGRLVDECTVIFEENLKAKEIELLRDVDSSTPVQADYNMISTVLRNLLSNAIKFSPVGGSVWLRAETNEARVRIEVSDSGAGIPEHIVGDISNNQPVSSTRGTQGEKGTGLGLTLCREFVAKHGSELHINTSPNGTSIAFTLEIVAETAPSHP